jgi:hypothetical protein
MHNAKFIFVLFIIAFLAIIAISIHLSGGVEKFIERLSIDLEALVHGQFQILPQPPTVNAIYLEHPIMGLTNCTNTYTDCSTDPLENSTRYPNITVMIRDTSGNCDIGHVYVTVCKPGMGLCNATNYDRTAELSFLVRSSDHAYCNYSTNAIGFDYYEIPGDWGVYANTTVGSMWNSNEPYAVRFWYRPWAGFVYPASGSPVNMGTLSVDDWNNGTGDTPPTVPEAKNTGNVQVNATWNASNFNSGSDVFVIDGTNYAVDDDKDGTSDAGNFPEVYINPDPTKAIIFPYDPFVGEYLDVCSNFNCDGLGDQDARLNIYWHIKIPIGQPAGTYSNDISIEHIGI